VTTPTPASEETAREQMARDALIVLRAVAPDTTRFHKLSDSGGKCQFPCPNFQQNGTHPCIWRATYSIDGNALCSRHAAHVLLAKADRGNVYVY